jgi:hypothetical protein
MAPAIDVVSIGPSQMFEDEVYCPPPPPEVEDECLTPEVLLHVAYEVVSQLDKAEESMLLSLEEHSLPDFLVEQISAP